MGWTVPHLIVFWKSSNGSFSFLWLDLVVVCCCVGMLEMLEDGGEDDGWRDLWSLVDRRQVWNILHTFAVVK
jgi:hypothetical protein